MIKKKKDFGLSRNVGGPSDGVYLMGAQSKTPWRWSSPETLEDRICTKSSDVWMLG